MNDSDAGAVISDVEDEAAAIGASVFAHALDIDSGAEVGVRSDVPVVMASVFKVPVLTEFVREVVAGELDPFARITVKHEHATPWTDWLVGLRRRQMVVARSRAFAP